MLIVNKLSVHLLPVPSFVLLMQFFTSWAAVKAVGKMGLIVVDALEWSKFRAFFLVSIAFQSLVFANMKVLQHSNVETFIIFRASTPLVVSVLDVIFLGRQLPDLRSQVVRSACNTLALLAAEVGDHTALDRPMGMATVDLRYDILTDPTPEDCPDGWAFFEFRMLDFGSGWTVDEATVWAADGTPLAIARQRRKLAPVRPARI